MPRRGHRPCRRRDLQIRRHHALCHAHEPYFSGRSQKTRPSPASRARCSRCQAAAAAEGLFYPPDQVKKDRLDRRQRHHERRRHEGRALRPYARFRALHRTVLPDGSIMNFSSNVVKKTPLATISRIWSSARRARCAS